MSDLKNTSYLFGSNAAFIEELYNLYIADPASVSDEWKRYFRDLGDSSSIVQEAVKGTAWKPYKNKVIGVVDKELAPKAKPLAASTLTVANISNENDLIHSLRATNLINAYRSYGHLGVSLDPLGLVKPMYHAELDYRHHGITDGDLDIEVTVEKIFGHTRFKIKELIAKLKAAYSDRIATEFVHIESIEERNWIQERLEVNLGMLSVSKEEKITALQDSMEAEMFENFLHTKFPGTKRFSVEGGENGISALEVIIRNSAKMGVEECILGMAHRGRLVTLTKVMGKPYHAMLSEFKGNFAFPDNTEIPGDVKYHLGNSADIEIAGNKMHLSLTPNPSHLEVVNSVVLGKVRAKQDLIKDFTRSRVLGILIHGDAAFSGQGSVMESLSLSQLPYYHTGGTMHLVLNNQIGFTTNVGDSRSTAYCTDIAKYISIPIFHVNGDDAEAVVFAAKLAAEYRAKFKKDVVIDVVCYRKYGHNEGDEPFFTQPLMYTAIKSKITPPAIYAKKLIAEGVIAEADYKNLYEKFKRFLDAEFLVSQSYKPAKADWLEGNWSKMQKSKAYRIESALGVDKKILKKIGTKLSSVPSGFNANPKIVRILEAREKMFESGMDIDWGTGESLAYGTLLLEGFNIRMTGQDVQRGTFSHRHAVLTDQVNQSTYTALNDLHAEQTGKLEIGNSNLSEFAVMAFEYGYSITDPMTLTIWEGQFGDFANGAQVIIDQYVTSGEAKWLRMSGLVLLLPHGYEGQGPEHSSARLERFLQLCARDNIQVANCTTPASLFHIMRRQMHQQFRKPLVIMSPKSLLRHKLAVSTIEEMSTKSSFKPVIGEIDGVANEDKVKKVVLCTGKVYYDILERRREKNIDDMVIIRLEQIYPFPNRSLTKELVKYKNAEIIWCQEEHENMGAYYFLVPRIESVLAEMNHKTSRIKYVGRERSASPAVGYMKLHNAELEKFMFELFNN